MLFRDDIETDKFCRALFYNINAKQIPLKMGHNFKIIIESEQTFDDETLNTAFGFNETAINPPAELGRLTDAGGGEQSIKIENSAV